MTVIRLPQCRGPLRRDFPAAPKLIGLATARGWGIDMKLYRVNKLAKPGGVIVKKKHVLAATDAEAVKQAEDSIDCPVCEVLHNGKAVGQIL